MSEMTFLDEPGQSPERDSMYGEDIADEGFVMNLTRAWAWQPGLNAGLFDLLNKAKEAADLSFRQRALLVTASASGRGDSYCTLAWGSRLAKATDVGTATDVIRDGDSPALPPEEAALARWARLLATKPNETTPDHIAGLRAAGFDDAGILAISVFVALRIAFSTVNDALGARPDRELVEQAPEGLVAAIDFGRAPGGAPS
jgi:alkylhydroperoxidase family enzyme